MIKLKATNEKELVAEAVNYSKQNPSLCVLAYTIFESAYIKTAKKPHYNWIGDTHLNGYFKGGEFIKFDKKLNIAYQNTGLTKD